MIDTHQHTWPSQNSPLSDYGYDFMSPQPNMIPHAEGMYFEPFAFGVTVGYGGVTVTPHFTLRELR
jgi:hypothetical protein